MQSNINIKDMYCFYKEPSVLQIFLWFKYYIFWPFSRGLWMVLYFLPEWGLWKKLVTKVQ